MPISAPRRRAKLEDYNPYLYYNKAKGAGQSSVTGSTLMDKFKQTFMNMPSADEMYKAESAPVESAFEEAGESMRSRLAALGGGGNVRAIQAGEERLATTKSEALGKLKSETSQRALTQSLLGAQLLKLLSELGGAGAGLARQGSAYLGR